MNKKHEYIHKSIHLFIGDKNQVFFSFDAKMCWEMTCFRLSIKKLVLWFWTCIYFYILSDKVFHSDHDGSHGFAQFGHFTGFFYRFKLKNNDFCALRSWTWDMESLFFHIIWKYKSWSYRHRFVSFSTVSVGAPTQVKWRVNLSAKTLKIVYLPKHCFKLNGWYLWTDIMLFRVINFQNNHFEVI